MLHVLLLLVFCTVANAAQYHSFEDWDDVFETVNHMDAISALDNVALKKFDLLGVGTTVLSFSDITLDVNPDFVCEMLLANACCVVPIPKITALLGLKQYIELTPALSIPENAIIHLHQIVPGGMRLAQSTDPNFDLEMDAWIQLLVAAIEHYRFPVVGWLLNNRLRFDLSKPSHYRHCQHALVLSLRADLRQTFEQQATLYQSLQRAGCVTENLEEHDRWALGLLETREHSGEEFGEHHILEKKAVLRALQSSQKYTKRVACAVIIGCNNDWLWMRALRLESALNIITTGLIGLISASRYDLLSEHVVNRLMDMLQEDLFHVCVSVVFSAIMMDRALRYEKYLMLKFLFSLGAPRLHSLCGKDVSFKLDFAKIGFSQVQIKEVMMKSNYLVHYRCIQYLTLMGMHLFTFSEIAEMERFAKINQRSFEQRFASVTSVYELLPNFSEKGLFDTLFLADRAASSPANVLEVDLRSIPVPPNMIQLLELHKRRVRLSDNNIILMIRHQAYGFLPSKYALTWKELLDALIAHIRQSVNVSLPPNTIDLAARVIDEELDFEREYDQWTTLAYEYGRRDRFGFIQGLVQRGFSFVESRTRSISRKNCTLMQTTAAQIKAPHRRLYVQRVLEEAECPVSATTNELVFSMWIRRNFEQAVMEAMTNVLTVRMEKVNCRHFEVESVISAVVIASTNANMWLYCDMDASASADHMIRGMQLYGILRKGAPISTQAAGFLLQHVADGFSYLLSQYVLQELSIGDPNICISWLKAFASVKDVVDPNFLMRKEHRNVLLQNVAIKQLDGLQMPAFLRAITQLCI